MRKRPILIKEKIGSYIDASDKTKIIQNFRLNKWNLGNNVLPYNVKMMKKMMMMLRNEEISAQTIQKTNKKKVSDDARK